MPHQEDAVPTAPGWNPTRNVVNERALTIPEEIAQIYYRHGLRCSSRPYWLLAFTILVFIVSCYPMVYIPLLGSSSHHYSTYSAHTGDSKAPPLWYQGRPVAYIQQVIVRTAVSPWEGLQKMDAFRAPLHEAFRISELVSNHMYTHDSKTPVSLHDLCLQVHESSFKESLLPQYSCLVVSPALIWQKDPSFYQADSHILDTILSQGGTSNTLREILFGVPWKETGLKRMCLQKRQRVLTYAVTLLLDKYDSQFIESLRLKLLNENPLFGQNNTTPEHEEQLNHINFHYVHHVAEFLPLLCVYLVMLLYVYFSMSKMHLIRSKLLLSLATVSTVFLSTVMSIGISLWAGLNPTLNGSPLVSPRAESCLPSEILPYLLVIIGLENSLCITNSVVNPRSPMGAKVRLAQGLSKEGWSIVKNLLTEMSLLTLAFFTFVTVIQEFCMFALIGVLSDFFLQHVFYCTVLSLDLQRKQNLELARGRDLSYSDSEFERSGRNVPLVSYPTHQRMSRVFAGPASQAGVLGNVPRRLKLLYIWAKLRFVQRTLMAIMIVWIVFLVHHSGVIERLSNPQNSTLSMATGSGLPLRKYESVQGLSAGRAREGHGAQTGAPFDAKSSEQMQTDDNQDNPSVLIHRKFSMWKDLPTSHWTTLFGYYNISLAGKYITLLPSIHLSLAIPPSTAISLRHPNDDATTQFCNWNILNKIKFDDMDDTTEGDSSVFAEPLFLMLTIPTTFFIVYLVVVLYRCVCSRNYAEWRTSWNNRSKRGAFAFVESIIEQPSSYQLMDTFPIKLTGHKMPIENLVCDDNSVISSSLIGNIRVWDATTGECLNHIQRGGESSASAGDTFSQKRKNHQINRKTQRQTGSFSSDSTYGSSPSAESPETATLARARSFDMSSNAASPGHYSLECGSPPEFDSDLSPVQGSRAPGSDRGFDPVWSMGCYDSWLILGCASGRLEMWHALSGTFCDLQDLGDGVVALLVNKHEVYAATEGGTLTHFHLERSSSEFMKFIKLSTVRAHTQAVSVIACGDAGGPVVTGSLDRLVKVFRLENLACIFTLHGHSGAISAVEVDDGQAVSGCQQGMLCLWDLPTGTCVYSIEAHKSAICSIRITPLYVITLAFLDQGRMRIWEKSQGHLLHSVSNVSVSPYLELLSEDIAVTAKEDHLVLWDVHRGESIQVIILGNAKTGVRTLSRASANTLVCDYGQDLCVIYFPALTSKNE